jgi:hypothetical protein
VKKLKARRYVLFNADAAYLTTFGVKPLSKSVQVVAEQFHQDSVGAVISRAPSFPEARFSAALQNLLQKLLQNLQLGDPTKVDASQKAVDPPAEKVLDEPFAPGVDWLALSMASKTSPQLKTRVTATMGRQRAPSILERITRRSVIRKG